MKRWLEWVKANAMPLTTALCLAVFVVPTGLLVMGAVSSTLRVDWSEHLPALTAIGLGCFLALAGSLMALVRVRERANNAEKALDSTNDGYWILSPTGAFIDVNQSYCRMMGYTRNEVMSMSIADFEAVARTEQIQAQIQGILKSGRQTFETRHRHRNGDWVDLEITATGAFCKTGSSRRWSAVRVAVSAGPSCLWTWIISSWSMTVAATRLGTHCWSRCRGACAPVSGWGTPSPVRAVTSLCWC
jgi:PAS domain S-box-containing protein